MTSTPVALDDVREICKRLRNVLPAKALLHEPNICGNEWRYVKECLDTGWVSSVGRYVDLFEEKLAEFTGIKRAVAVVNGTAGLHLALTMLGVKANDEVIVPAFSFVAPVNAVAYCGAVPVFMDAEENRMGIDPRKLSRWLEQNTETRNNGCWDKVRNAAVRALIAVHIYGHPCRIGEIAEICRKYKIELIEDCAEALGSYEGNRHVGHHGKLSVLSFNGNKIVTTGGGGAVLTNDEGLAKEAKHLSTTAKQPHPWRFFHDRVGYNYRLPNINAAMGCAQLEILPRFLNAKRALAEKYRTAFSGLDGVRLVWEPDGCRSNFWLNTLVFGGDRQELRDRLLEETNKIGLQTRPAWDLISSFPMYKEAPGSSLNVANDLCRRVINLPSGSAL